MKNSCHGKKIPGSEAAGILGISPATLRNWEKSGRAPKRDTEGFYNASQLQEFMLRDAYLQVHKTRRHRGGSVGRIIPREYMPLHLLPPGFIDSLSFLASEFSHLSSFILQCVVLKYFLDSGHVIAPDHNIIKIFYAAPGRVKFCQGRLMTDLIGVLHRESIPLIAMRKIAGTIEKFRFNPVPFDFVGFIHLCLISHHLRKQKGQYFTPNQICHDVIDALHMEIPVEGNSRLLDPACGAGQFLISVYREMSSLYKRRGIPDGERHERILAENIHGFDLDPIAVTLCKLNLLCQKKQAAPCEPHILQSNFLAGAKQKALEQYHYIFGNPPWGAQNEASAPAPRSLPFSNTFAAFLARGIEQTIPGGGISFLVPEALLNIRAYSRLRELILERTFITRITHCGNIFAGVFSPAVIIAMQKKHPAAKAEHRPVTIMAQNQTVSVSQDCFRENPFFIFNTRHTDAYRKIKQHILSLPMAYLKDQALFGMGIVTGDNRRFVAEKPLNALYQPVLLAGDIQRYIHGAHRKYVEYNRAVLQQVAPHSLYAADEKLIYRFISKRLVFAYDNKQHLILNNANLLIPQIPLMSVKYILALMNSRFLQYIYENTFSALKVLRSNLENLPLVIPSKRELINIEEIITQILEKPFSSARNSLEMEIEEAVLRLYECPKQFSSIFLRI
ncbi:MAG: N-6 DNA methylase [Bacillota bacterium]